MAKIGKFAATALLGIVMSAPALVSPALAAGEITFKATVDQSEISMDDSVSLKLSVEAEGVTQANDPQFSAPDFDVVNEFSSNYVQSYYDGSFHTKNTQQLTKVLKPRKTGNLKISGISVTSGGKVYRAPDVTVQVHPSGSGTPPPKGYGGSGVGLRGAGKRVTGSPVIVRAEIDKDKAYKGEQIVVSYYLYRRVRVFNIQVDKFPVLNGFLREDLEMPVMGQRLDSDRVVLDGVVYERSLLMRYAAYPLQEGKLKIDSTALKYSYYPDNGRGSPDDEDPFMNFFRQMNPRQGNGRSELLTVEVMPLPEEGKPMSFTGGVGDFNVSAAVDKTEVRANDAVTVTVKVEGRGNVAAIGEPKVRWPENVELYDSKGVAKAGKQGVGEKTFEFLLIPRAAGKLELPPIEFSFFDPSKKTYVSRTIDPITINVLEGAPGSATNTPTASTPSASKSAAKPAAPVKEEPAGLKLGERIESKSGIPFWRWLYWGCVAMVLGLFGVIISDLLKRGRARAQAHSGEQGRLRLKGWAHLHEMARQAANGASWQDVLQAYETLASNVFEAMDRAYGVEARSRPRSELRALLVDDKGMKPELWKKASEVLEQVELVRFALSAGAVSESSARQELARWVEQGEAVSRELAG